MSEVASFFVSIWIKFFFLFTPFFVLSMFLSMTAGYDEARRRRLALQVTGAVGVVCFALYFFGNVVFALFGITVDAFRVGAGGLLFLSAVALVQARPATAEAAAHEDIAVVPLAVPIVVGPATTGALLVLGAEIPTVTLKIAGCLALVAAIACLGTILILAASLERWLGRKGINILTKVTGLVLAALAAQMILTGVRGFWVSGSIG